MLHFDLVYFQGNNKIDRAVGALRCFLKEVSLNEVSSNLNYPIPKNTLGNLPIRTFFALNTTGQLTVIKLR